MRYLGLAILVYFLTAGNAFGDTNQVRNTAFAAGVSAGMYTACRVLFKSDDTFGCALGSALLTNIVMVWNYHTSDNDRDLGDKIMNHAIGSTIVIPLSIFY